MILGNAPTHGRAAKVMSPCFVPRLFVMSYFL
jgi:hypothetical protein